jgi:hypothetical protein
MLSGSLFIVLMWPTQLTTHTHGRAVVRSDQRKLSEKMTLHSILQLIDQADCENIYCYLDSKKKTVYFFVILFV